MLKDNLEDRAIKGTDGKIVLVFEDKEAKELFEKQLVRMYEWNSLIKSEGYVCGHCADYPCFRYPKKDQPVGLCFQPVRR